MMQGDMPFLEEYDGTTELSYIENPEGDEMDISSPLSHTIPKLARSFIYILLIQGAINNP